MRSGVVLSDFLNIKVRNTITAAKIIKTMPVNSLRKSINESPAALPMMMFGGSPISVAVPPILEAKISVNKNGMADTFNFCEIANVIGITKMTVVTLSRKALTKAVKKPSAHKISKGRPRVDFKIPFAI